MTFPSLDDERYMSLLTFRRSGAEVATPMWFAAGNGRVFVGTFPETGKVKRVKANPEVRVAPCNFRGLVSGPYVPGRARVLDGDEATEAQAALVSKYGWQWRLFGRQIDLYMSIEPV
ncbi:MAG: PPOX class F420-dependent oxidoreductase [Acidimicrobiia bacterium]|nr:PPOX class F420-dependent oxidoreductase [Acidimicrobiia bacterium]